VPIVTEVPFLEPIDDWLKSQVEKDDYAPEYQDDGEAKDVKGGVEGADYFLRLTSGIRRGKNAAKVDRSRWQSRSYEERYIPDSCTWSSLGCHLVDTGIL
jgi:hypothetical protein